MPRVFCLRSTFFVGHGGVLLIFLPFLFPAECLREMKGTGREPILDRDYVRSILAVVYVFYAAVQIIYLFLRAGTLPGDLTYSQYAHEGFWQLVMVSVINIVMVLICMQVFQKAQGAETVVAGDFPLHVRDDRFGGLIGWYFMSTRTI